MNKNINKLKQEKVLLTLLPYWTPLIPPMGILSIKSFLQQYGYDVVVNDSNTDEDFKTIYNLYFEKLGKCIPMEKGNIGNHFHNIGLNVFHDHMLIYFNKKNDVEYRELFKKIVYNTFSYEIEDYIVNELTDLIKNFYEKLENHIIKLIEANNPSVIGCSVYKHTLASSLFAFDLIKKKYPNITTVMGGGIFTQTLSVGSDDLDYFVKEASESIDYILIGEGELLFLKLLKGELSKNKKLFTLDDINGETIDLEESPKIDYSDLDLDKYPMQGAYLSRGCPYKCNFCAETVIWKTYREKQANQFIDELKSNYEKYGTKFFWTCDSLVNVYISELSHKIIESDLDVYWDGYLRADEPVCNIDNTLLWREAGFYKARIGVESGSQKMLNLMNKKITVNQIKKAVSSLAYAGIKTTTYWIIGYPGETEEDFKQTLNLVEEIKDDLYEVMCEPFYYFVGGQVNSDEWIKENNIHPIYNDSERKMTLTQTWEMECEPSRKVRYERLNKFVAHCEKLGIPTPYTVKEIDYADTRWKLLHKNSVPPMTDFISKKEIEDNRKIKSVSFANNVDLDDGEFLF